MKTKNQTTLASKYWLLILSMICIILMGLSLVTDKVNGPLRTVANYTIVPMLLLKNAPKDDAGNAMLPEDVVELMK